MARDTTFSPTCLLHQRPMVAKALGTVTLWECPACLAGATPQIGGGTYNRPEPGANEASRTDIERAARTIRSLLDRRSDYSVMVEVLDEYDRHRAGRLPASETSAMSKVERVIRAWFAEIAGTDSTGAPVIQLPDPVDVVTELRAHFDAESNDAAALRAEVAAADELRRRAVEDRDAWRAEYFRLDVEVARLREALERVLRTWATYPTDSPPMYEAIAAARAALGPSAASGAQTEASHGK